MLAFWICLLYVNLYTLYLFFFADSVEVKFTLSYSLVWRILICRIAFLQNRKYTLQDRSYSQFEHKKKKIKNQPLVLSLYTNITRQHGQTFQTTTTTTSCAIKLLIIYYILKTHWHTKSYMVYYHLTRQNKEPRTNRSTPHTKPLLETQLIEFLSK